MNNNFDVAEVINQLKKRGVSQNDIANKLQVTRQAVFYWGKRKKRPSLRARKELARLARKNGIEIQEG